ncbi:PA2779 family protein [Undibacterium sp. Jales W-56]|uniref:PA2779 family protein n=1 Tax=Undibacterium sp. Jales W-56 TaxID=2897325 RepID=UPI0021D11589|nr:PA2779 family protein [Undibacterium sp. Jales W-56]MCU6432388.1 PA2779 family protein [Undibacterium sp. Jales W-56]
MSAFKRLVSATMIVTTTLVGMPIAAHAEIVPTDESMSTTVSAANRERVTNFFNRADVRNAMQQQGVNGDAALERVNAMSDAEVAQLAGRIDKAPAGGEILGIIFTVFIILLVTDILGLTKVFPFTRSVR